MEERFDFELDKAVREIRKRKAKKVLLQFPEGIKRYSTEVAGKLEQDTKAEIIVSGESNWGGCDLALEEAKLLGVDLLIHFGHVPFIKKTSFPVVYIPIKDNYDIMPLIRKSLVLLKNYKKIGVVSSIQHIHFISKVKKFYEENGKEVFIPRGIGFAFTAGHVVGCEYSGLKQIKNDIDIIVAIGNRFHGVGAALAVLSKTVILVDTYNFNADIIDDFRDKIVKQRAIAISMFEKAKNIGIIAGLKPGQKFGSWQSLKKEFEKIDKKVTVITMREFNPDKMMNFYGIDGFVELACPRIATDDYGKYQKPLLTFREALVVLKKLKWEELLEEGLM